MTTTHLNVGDAGFVAHAMECPSCRAKLNTADDQRTLRGTCGHPAKNGTECRACALARWEATR